MLNIKVIYEGTERDLSVPFDSKRTLKDILEDAGMAVSAPCGGMGICGRCMVNVDGKEELSCTYVPEKDITVTVSRRKNDVVKSAPELGELPDVGISLGLGLALDLGTTTVAAFLYDLQSGKCLGMTGAENAQRRFGADVISRIRYAENDRKMLQLTSLIREQVFDLGMELCAAASTKEKQYGMQDIRYISIAGNTVMQSLFAAITPKPIGEAPFTPISLFGEELVAEPTMYYCPCISGYVGGDITAGILSTGIYQANETVLLMDLGTNCEFALGDRNGFFCVSAPAGPSFGRGAGSDQLHGSEFISLAARFLSEGVIDETGRFYGDKYREKYGDELKKRALKKADFDAESYMKQLASDIRSLQLAKAAVGGALGTIFRESGISADDVKRVYVAGGFGSFLDPESAFTLGLFPEAFRGKVVMTGNSAGEGACLALRQENREILKKIAGICTYRELSGSKVFDEEYIEAMCFGQQEE